MFLMSELAKEMEEVRGCLNILSSNACLTNLRGFCSTSQAAKAAILAGNRRKSLAASVSATSSSTSNSGSGKRSHVSVQGTQSTKVTPDPKHTCGVVPTEPVQPVKLAFDDADGNGTGGGTPPTERGGKREREKRERERERERQREREREGEIGREITDYAHINIILHVISIYIFIYVNVVCMHVSK